MADAESPPVSVVIPSWNTRDHLRACIASVKGETDLTVELFVIDNGSVDGSVEVLEQAGAAYIGLSGECGLCTGG